MAPPMAVEVVGVTDTSSKVVLSDSNAQGGKTNGINNMITPPNLAPYAAKQSFKKKPQHGKPMAKRWDAFLSEEAKSRKPSSLKAAGKFLKQPGLISLGGGLPSSNNFPIERLSAKIPNPPEFTEEQTKESGVWTSIGKYDMTEGTGEYDLSVALQYGQGPGTPVLLRFVTEHTEMIHDPPYEDWACCLGIGSTSYTDMAYRMFTERGDYILAEEYTFATAVETAMPMGLRVIGIKMDEEGLVPSHMDEILTNWSPSARNGAQKPHLLYTVPSGQNPTGATQGLQRRKEVYAMAQKHDIFIIEDEPYYFLQMQPYASDGPAAPPPANHEEFIKALIPSLLSMDVDGRVMRLDSFSKVIAPGCRCSWITASEQIIERMVRHNEVSTQTVSGLSQAVLVKMLDETWGHAGYLDWLIHMRMEYTSRRDVLLKACEAYLPCGVASWSAPAAGMFHWVGIDWKKHPKAKEGLALLEVEDLVFTRAVERGVLVSKGSWFRAQKDAGEDMYFRLTFAAAREEQMEEAVRRLGGALREEFGL